MCPLSLICIYLVSLFLLFIQLFTGLSKMSLKPRASRRVRLRAGLLVRSPWCWSSLFGTCCVSNPPKRHSLLPSLTNSQILRALFSYMSPLLLAASGWNKALKRGHSLPASSWARPPVDVCMALLPQEMGYVNIVSEDWGELDCISLSICSNNIHFWTRLLF